ncbi:KAT8 regulatory NSL complex subunit 2-like isoform X1 [Euwallacea fornicatus]|uniref:KAT8 regulatory NSL complex subunit 2-like isoform X1 n=1 Tax=Euwallacea fornicatus TaxID=995702 RepID=UPI00339048E8
MEKNAKGLLRAQIEAEVCNKRNCAYESYECSLLSLDNSKYCIKHVLKDKNAPYKQCNFTYQYNGKRCNLPAPKGDKKDYGFCNEHSLKTTLSRNKLNAKNPPPLTAESLLTNLSHYIRKPRNRSLAGTSHTLDEESSHAEDGESRATRVIDPFVDIDAAAVYNDHCNEVLDMCSESESDVEASTYATVWHDANADSSDNESFDSEDEDPLKHANVYTPDEIILLTRDKLVRLQSLYIEEYKHLRYLLRERRRKYLHSLKREKETCCNIYNQVRDNPQEQRLYRKLKQYNKYHKSFGEEAIMEKRLHDLRAKLSDVGSSRSSSSKCQFTEGGVKCPERSLPTAKHCRKHILEDPHQVLFKACGKTKGDIECCTPVEAIFDDSTCKLHMDIPLIRSYIQPRTSQGSKCKGKESETDPEDSLDLPPYALPSSDSVKRELMNYSLPAIPKMEMLPSILFEDSAESLSSTLQYSTSEFTESFVEPNSVDVTETNSSQDVEVNVTTNAESANNSLHNADISSAPIYDSPLLGVQCEKTVMSETNLINIGDAPATKLAVEENVTISSERNIDISGEKAHDKQNIVQGHKNIVDEKVEMNISSMEVSEEVISGRDTSVEDIQNVAPIEHVEKMNID